MCIIPMRVLPSPEEFLSSLEHYEIAFPIQVDQNGDFLTFDMRRQLKPRPRRSLPYEPSEQQVFYKVSAHHTQFLLNLTLHSNLLAEHFTVEYWKRDGMDWQHDFHEDCHYAGHLQDQYLSSKVAISNCNGLVSLVWPARGGANSFDPQAGGSMWWEKLGVGGKWEYSTLRSPSAGCSHPSSHPRGFFICVSLPDPFFWCFPIGFDWNGMILALWGCPHLALTKFFQQQHQRMFCVCRRAGISQRCWNVTSASRSFQLHMHSWGSHLILSIFQELKNVTSEEKKKI